MDFYSKNRILREAWKQTEAEVEGEGTFPIESHLSKRKEIAKKKLKKSFSRMEMGDQIAENLWEAWEKGDGNSRPDLIYNWGKHGSSSVYRYMLEPSKEILMPILKSQLESGDVEMSRFENENILFSRWIETNFKDKINLPLVMDAAGEYLKVKFLSHSPNKTKDAVEFNRKEYLKLKNHSSENNQSEGEFEREMNKWYGNAGGVSTGLNKGDLDINHLGVKFNPEKAKDSAEKLSRAMGYGTNRYQGD